MLHLAVYGHRRRQQQRADVTVTAARPSLSHSDGNRWASLESGDGLGQFHLFFVASMFSNQSFPKEQRLGRDGRQAWNVRANIEDNEAPARKVIFFLIYC